MMRLQFYACRVLPHLHSGGSQRCLVDNKVLQTHKRDADIIYGDDAHLCRRELQIYTFVTSTDVSIAFLFNASPFHSLNPSLISFLFLSCPVFIPLFSFAPHSQIPSMPSQLLLYLTNIADIPPLLYHLS